MRLSPIIPGKYILFPVILLLLPELTAPYFVLYFALCVAFYVALCVAHVFVFEFVFYGQRYSDALVYNGYDNIDRFFPEILDMRVDRWGAFDSYLFNPETAGNDIVHKFLIFLADQEVGQDAG